MKCEDVLLDATIRRPRGIGLYKRTILITHQIALISQVIECEFSLFLDRTCKTMEDKEDV